MLEAVVGIYDDAVSEILRTLRSATDSILIIAIRGADISGKSAVAIEAMKRWGSGSTLSSFSQLAMEGPVEFLATLKDLRSGVMLGMDELSNKEVSLLSDFVFSLRFGVIQGASRVWLIPSISPVPFADKEVWVADLCSSSDTRSQLCRILLEGFPCDPECPLNDILYQSSGKLSLGELKCLVEHAKTLSLSSEVPFSCYHLSQAFHAFTFPLTPISIPRRPGLHSCEFISSVTVNKSLESFIGLSPENKEIIDSFIDLKIRSKLLLISGPIGSGKSHLASAIAWNPTRPAIRVTAADILRSKIGETEKALHAALSSGSRIIIEDLDKLVPEDSTDATGSVQRCLPVLVSFLDRIRYERIRVDDFMLIGTTRSVVNPRLSSKMVHLELGNRLSFSQKLSLITSAYPDYEVSNISEFDLINLSNRSSCVEFGREKNMERLRLAINSKIS